MENSAIVHATFIAAMNNSTIRARMSFSFKGDPYELDTTLDLERCTAEPGEAPNFPLLLAKAAGIDTYSYLYEVMESHDIVFSDATGPAAQCCRDGQFDWSEFERLRQEAQDMQVVRAIAERSLGVVDLDQRADLKEALLAAYRVGKGTRAA
jgi:hypothetical protein